MVLGKSVFNEDGELMLAAGFHVKTNIIQRLIDHDFTTVWIHEEGTEEIFPEEVISDQVSRQATVAVKDAAAAIGDNLQMREDTQEGIQKQMKDTKKFKNLLAAPKIQKAVGAIIDDLLGNPDVVLNLSTLRSQQSYLFQHAVDVTVIALMIAGKLRFMREELNDLGTGSILHDIGMSVLPDKLVQKKQRLTFQEYNLIKEHPTYGYTILRENSSISPVSTAVAFQHHERQDGFGYPRGMKGNNLLPIRTLTPEKGYMHRFAEIVAVADAYDAMASPRPFMRQRSPQEIIKQLIVAAGTQLNRAIVDVLISLIPIYPVGAFIKVTKANSRQLVGCTGAVAVVRKGYFDKPTIILLRDPAGRKIKPLKVDLIQYPDIEIQFVPLKTARIIST